MSISVLYLIHLNMAPLMFDHVVPRVICCLSGMLDLKCSILIAQYSPAKPNVHTDRPVFSFTYGQYRHESTSGQKDNKKKTWLQYAFTFKPNGRSTWSVCVFGYILPIITSP